MGVTIFYCPDSLQMDIFTYIISLSYENIFSILGLVKLAVLYRSI